MNSLTLTFDQQQLEVLSQALVQQPYATVAPLIAEINRQLQEINSQAPNPVKPSNQDT